VPEIWSRVIPAPLYNEAVLAPRLPRLHSAQLTRASSATFSFSRVLPLEHRITNAESSAVEDLRAFEVTIKLDVIGSRAPNIFASMPLHRSSLQAVCLGVYRCGRQRAESGTVISYSRDVPDARGPLLLRRSELVGIHPIRGGCFEAL